MDLAGADAVEVADRDGAIADLVDIDRIDGEVMLSGADGADADVGPAVFDRGPDVDVGIGSPPQSKTCS